MIRYCLTRTALGAAALCAAATLAFGQNQLRERTRLTFSEPVMIPGATLQPGTYVFELVDPTSSQHLVRVTTEDGSTLITTTHAVPMSRPMSEREGDVIVKFDPTDAGSPPALKGWFYPGATVGHQFLYPASQAREIAQRTKTVVLSLDVPGEDASRGAIVQFDERGARTTWQPDPGTTQAWEEWRREHAATAEPSRQATAEERSEARAPMIESQPAGMRVTLDDIEDNPTQYLGKTVSVDAEVEDVIGPRLFVIDEPNWADLEGETLVQVPANMAALVSENDRVTVTGTVQSFVRADFDREFAWLGIDDELTVDLARKPVIVASKVVGGNDDIALIVEVGEAGAIPSAVGTPPAMTDLAALVRADDDDDGIIGRAVSLRNVTVESMATAGGFFVKHGDTRLFVMPAMPDTNVEAGQSIALTGLVLELSDDMEDRVEMLDGANDDVYVYATAVK